MIIDILPVFTHHVSLLCSALLCSPPSKTGIVAALTIPALYHRHQECIDTYMSFAYMNLRMYEMVYERLSMKCFLRVRDWIMELLKDP